MLANVEEMRPFVDHLPTVPSHPAEMLARAHLKPQVRLLPCLDVLALEPDQLLRRPAIGRIRPPEEHERRVLPVHGPVVLHLDHGRELELLTNLVANAVDVVAHVVFGRYCPAGGEQAGVVHWVLAAGD